MTHYEERLERDLTRIRERAENAARYAERAVSEAVKSMLVHDDELSYRTALGDHWLNREIRAIDRLCHAFIARHLPSAGHLRFVSAVLRINVAVERIGDYATTIARESVQLTERPPRSIRQDLEMMARQSSETLLQAIEAFARGNAELARGTIAMAKQVDTSFDKVFDDMVAAGEASKRPLADLFALMITFNRVERVSDQAKNLCEQVIFAETGEEKARKRYRVVFVDDDNACLSVMAAAIAAKAYPNSGSYASAGWAPAEALEPGFEAFMDRRGHSVEGYRPVSVAEHLDPLDEVHVVVGLAGDPRPHLPPLPYHTAMLIWDAEKPGAGLDRERTDAVLDRVYRDLAGRVEDLMIRLQGEGAD